HDATLPYLSTAVPQPARRTVKGVRSSPRSGSLDGRLGQQRAGYPRIPQETPGNNTAAHQAAANWISDSPCNWSQTNHVHSGGIAREEIGCDRMGGLAGPHINTTLVILISALYANARLLKAVPTPTKRQARERAAHSASRGMSGGGFARGRTSSRPHSHRSIPRRSSSRFRRSVPCGTQ